VLSVEEAMRTLSSKLMESERINTMVISVRLLKKEIFFYECWVKLLETSFFAESKLVGTTTSCAVFFACGGGVS
jgi:hypothetical protein